MSHNPHSPGPWTISNRAYIRALNGFVVAQVRMPNARGKEYHEGAPYSRANARLIAAAPELLESLEWAVNEFDGNTRYDNAEQLQNCIEKCRAAIAKATAA